MQQVKGSVSKWNNQEIGVLDVKLTQLIEVDNAAQEHKSARKIQRPALKHMAFYVKKPKSHHCHKMDVLQMQLLSHDASEAAFEPASEVAFQVASEVAFQVASEAAFQPASETAAEHSTCLNL
uniref:Uncharacterized protein n=1 Tax=Oryza glumipatula TaxID=40148 RepID=A0A0E0BUE3_9ORYZ